MNSTFERNPLSELDRKLLEHGKTLPEFFASDFKEMEALGKVEEYFGCLGFNIQDDSLFRRNFPVDYDKENPETIHFALGSNLISSSPEILIEVVEENFLEPKATPHIRKCFDMVEATYGVITNGIVYQWYCRRENNSQNRLYPKPFLIVNASKFESADLEWMTKIGPELYKHQFHKIEAEILSFKREARQWVRFNLKEPSVSFTRYVIQEIPPYRDGTDEDVNLFRDALTQIIQEIIQENNQKNREE